MKNILLSKLIGQTERSIINWRNEGRPIIRLIETVFSEKNIVDFLEQGTIMVSPTPENSQRLYPIIKRSLKMRILDITNDQLRTKAFQCHIYEQAKKMAHILSSKVHNKTLQTDSLKLILKTIDEVLPTKSTIISEFILNKTQDFFINMTEDERMFIIQNPYEFSEIVHSTFSFTDKYESTP